MKLQPVTRLFTFILPRHKLYHHHITYDHFPLALLIPIFLKALPFTFFLFILLLLFLLLLLLLLLILLLHLLILLLVLRFQQFELKKDQYIT